MPNGRTGGFIMLRVDLEELVRAVSGSMIVGHLLGDGLPNRGGSASEVISLVKECSQERVAIEEQHRDSYIIHLSNEPIRWVSVASSSPLFLELRRRHSQWMAEHPGWKEWMGF